jgi:hypothetical protein
MGVYNHVTIVNNLLKKNKKNACEITGMSRY